MNSTNQARKIDLFSLKTEPMRAFHMTWVAFFVSFFGWFGVAPLMAVIRKDLSLSKEQVGNTIVASVAITIIVRLIVGPMCDRYGPKKVYQWLLILGALPLLGIGLSTGYETFLVFRLLIGAIGASFVITQYHTSLMFAPNCVGTANATTAGWGNLGGGVAQMTMPLIFAGIVALGFTDSQGWRIAMVIPGVLMIACGLLYSRLTKDSPDGDFAELRARGEMTPTAKAKGTFMDAAKDSRVWALFLIYGACFGVELTIHNIASIYYIDRFGVDMKTAGLFAGVFGVLAIFARTLGGWLSDKVTVKTGLKGRAWFLGLVILMEGAALVVFSKIPVLWIAVMSMTIFGLFVHMAAGATYAVIPFINKKATGSVAGIVGAGGNAGAVLTGMLFRSEAISMQTALYWMGVGVAVTALSAIMVRFPEAEKSAEPALSPMLAGAKS